MSFFGPMFSPRTDFFKLLGIDTRSGCINDQENTQLLRLGSTADVSWSTPVISRSIHTIGFFSLYFLSSSANLAASFASVSPRACRPDGPDVSGSVLLVSPTDLSVVNILVGSKVNCKRMCSSRMQGVCIGVQVFDRVTYEVLC